MQMEFNAKEQRCKDARLGSEISNRSGHHLHTPKGASRKGSRGGEQTPIKGRRLCRGDQPQRVSGSGAWAWKRRRCGTRCGWSRRHSRCPVSCGFPTRCLCVNRLLHCSGLEFTATLEKSPRGEYELTDAIAALIRTHHPLAGLQIQGRWVDVRDPEVLAALERE